MAGVELKTLHGCKLVLPGLKYGPHGYSAYPWRNGGQVPVLLLLARTCLSISMILVFNNASTSFSLILSSHGWIQTEDQQG